MLEGLQLVLITLETLTYKTLLIAAFCFWFFTLTRWHLRNKELNNIHGQTLARIKLHR